MRDFTLNPEQQKAVEHGEGPQLVIAGPGTGKTSVVAGRIIHLLRAVAGLQPENILALTYTRKAAEEMKVRVREALGNPPLAPHISTFHSLCEKILQENRAGHSLLDEVDVWIFLRRRMEQLGLKFYQKLAEPGAFLHDLNDFFSRCQDELVEPEDFDAYVRGVEAGFQKRFPLIEPPESAQEREELEKKRELARVFHKSRELMVATGCSSLGSLMSETIRLFDASREILEKYRQRFRYVLVDEFQDTNYGQVELLRRLVTPPYNVTAVGDDDQAIYRFRGASHGAFQMFADAFPGHRTVYLYRNHRSSRKILRCSDVLIGKNDHELKKPALKTEKGEGDPVFWVESADYGREAAWVRGEIERLVSRGRAYGDIAVLYRAHSHRDALVAELRRAGVPFAVRGLSLLTTVILRDLIAYLRVVHSPHQNVSLTRILLLPHWHFPEELALEIRHRAARDRCSLFDALESMEKASPAGKLSNTGWPELKNLRMELHRAAARQSITDLFELLISRLELNFLDGDDDLLYVDTFKKFLKDWEKKSETRRLREFFEYFDYFVEAGGKIEAPELPRLADAVRMMTVHAAKGLEFPVVFVLSVAAQRFPHRAQKPVIAFPEELHHGPELPPNLHTQEERRLFFVAMTRAKGRLYISSVTRPGGRQSTFVDDLLSNPAVRAGDIETVEAGALREPEVVVKENRSTPPTRPRPPAVPASQPSLFLSAIDSGRVHPPLKAWSAQPPASSARADGKIRLSATGVEEYLECPLKFKFSHLLKIPTGPQAALTFGSIMHRCVRAYFELARAKAPQFAEIEQIFLESWKSVGFEDSYQEETYKKAGLEQLRQFVEQQNQKAVAAGEIKLEESFSLDCGDFILEGRIDQINPLALESRGRRKGDGGAPVELIDYKTGRPRSQRDADKSLQLSVYALAARRSLKLDPVRLTLYHLSNGQTVSTVRTPQDLDRALEQIGAVAEDIRKSAFAPSKGWACKWCEFVPICPEHEDEG